ncbi:hypothetical protein KIN20_032126 [Parelaphostrongylus tenuis]|uniref:Uncharacterized protein n=1 Tax=Parelaphostrongylus tenuis TaxID=148309 RepID=A0AAD5R6H6_PARTN|nr:hypothetical protein KIN20_032126 [Parelaphostrongylus tenuis]
MDTTTERIDADAVPHQQPQKQTSSSRTVSRSEFSQGMTCFESDVHSESPATNVKSKSLLVKGKRVPVSRRSSVVPAAPEFNESSKAVTAAVSSKSSKIPAAHESSNLSKHVEVEEIANVKKQARHISVSKNGANQSRGSFGTTSSSVPTSQDRLLGEGTRSKRRALASTYISPQIDKPAHQYCPAVDVPTQVEGVDVLGADPIHYAISAPSTDIQSQEYSGSVPVKNDEAVTKRRFRKAFQPENKVAFTPRETSQLNVPPVKRSARVHKQVSFAESSAEVTPLVTPAMVPKTHECSSQKLQPLLNDIQSQRSLEVTPVRTDEAAIKKRFRRAVQSEKKTICTPSKTVNTNVSPSEGISRVYKQLSVPNSVNAITPLVTVAEFAEAHECPNQSMRPLSCDNQSPEDSEVTSMGCGSITRKSSRRGVQSGAKTASTPFRTIGADVSHKQVSDSESNAKEVAPLTAIEEVSSECPSQSMEVLLCDIQSPIDSQVTSVGCGSVTRKRSRRGVQSKTERACTPSGTTAADVSHKQVSDSEPNAKVVPLTAIENECPSQSPELLSCDNQSPEDSEVTSMGCGSITRKSSRRGVQSGAKTASTPFRTIGADVSHKQVSDSESNAK